MQTDDARPGDRAIDAAHLDRWDWDRRLRTLARHRAPWLVVTLCATLVASAIAGPDANWDFLNYHYYNGRALVTGSLLHDVAPAGIQTYLHPLVDVPIYLFVEAFGNRWGMVVWAGLLQWLCLIPVWRLTGALTPLRTSVTNRVIACALVVTASGAASLAFTTFGDWVIAALVCEAITRVLRALDDQDGPRSAMVVAGVFLGLAVGVKMTSATFAAAVACGVLLTMGLAATVRLTAGAIAAFAVLAGPWMVYLAVRFESPVFPFYNGLFGSSSAPDGNFDDGRYGAVSAFDLVRFPIDMFRGGTRYSELVLRDWRFAVLLVAVAVIAVAAPRAVIDRWLRDRQARFLAAFLLVGYATWIVMFGIYRYFLPAEIVVSLLVAVTAVEALRSRVRLAIVAITVLPLAMAYQTLPAWGRGDALSNAELAAAIEAQPTAPESVVFAGSPPFGFLAAGFPAETRFASLAGFLATDLTYAGPLAEDLDRFVREGVASGSIYVVLDAGVTQVPPPLESATIGECRPFTAVGRALVLCPLTGR